jgi:hypothetical protein
VSISGRVLGGWIPPSGEAVLLHIGWGGRSAEIGHLYTDRAGHFSALYTFHSGTVTETYRLWAVSANESDYPFAPAPSNRVAVTVRAG